jgi:hypothetical protein
MKTALIILLVMALAGGGVLAWKEVAPVMAVLKEKDPEKFETMLADAKSFNFTNAMQRYNELDQMSYEQVLTVRYNAKKKKILEDDDVRLEQWEEELEARDETRELIKEERQNQMRDLILLSEKRPKNVLSLNWNQSGPWEKGLLLREKCIKYLEMEKTAHQGIKKIHKLPRIAPLLDRPGELSLTAPEICEEFVPISHDEIQVGLALETLKNNMDYFFFVQLLDEIGVPRQEVFSFPSQLDRMTGGYAGS